MSKTMSRAFGCPQKYIQGPGEIANLPTLSAEYGKKPFFVIDSGVMALMFDKINTAYNEAGIPFGHMVFSGESCRENIDLIKNAASGSGCDIIVGFGGGKCLDAAKFASSELNWPRIIMPTSASTDAPAAGISVLYTNDGIHIRSEKMRRPTELVLIDTEILANAPARLFSAGIGDALATYFEAETNAKTEGMNFIGKGYRRCRAGMAIARECYDILMADGESALMAVKKHIVTEALENVIEANTLLSGLGFENTGCAGAHGIHSGFSEIESAHAYLHGEKVAFGLICQLVLENADYKLIDKIVRFLTGEVYIQHFSEAFNIQITDIVLVHDARIIYEYVQMTVLFINFAHCSSYGRLIRDIHYAAIGYLVVKSGTEFAVDNVGHDNSGSGII